MFISETRYLLIDVKGEQFFVGLYLRQFRYSCLKNFTIRMRSLIQLSTVLHPKSADEFLCREKQLFMSANRGILLFSHKDYESKSYLLSVLSSTLGEVSCPSF